MCTSDQKVYGKERVKGKGGGREGGREEREGRGGGRDEGRGGSEG